MRRNTMDVNSVDNEKQLALSVVKALTSFFLEMEGSKTKPTTVHMNVEQRNAVKKHFPYKLKGDKYQHGDHNYRIILTDSSESSVGVNFSYFTDFVRDYR
jgi:hypothetical protein